MSHGVDGEVPTGQVPLKAGQEGHRLGMPVVEICPVRPKGGDLHEFVIHDHSHGAMLLAGQDLRQIKEHPLRFVGQGGGAHVPVVGRFAPEDVPDAAAHGIGQVPRLAEPGKDEIDMLGYHSPIMGRAGPFCQRMGWILGGSHSILMLCTNE